MDHTVREVKEILAVAVDLWANTGNPPICAEETNQPLLSGCDLSHLLPNAWEASSIHMKYRGRVGVGGGGEP